MEVAGHPRGEFREPVAGPGLEAKGLRILLLAPGALQVDDQHARRRKRDLRAEVLLDERQGEVDPRGHAG